MLIKAVSVLVITLKEIYFVLKKRETMWAFNKVLLSHGCVVGQKTNNTKYRKSPFLFPTVATSNNGWCSLIQLLLKLPLYFGLYK